MFRGFYSLNFHQGSDMNYCGAYSTSRPQPASYNIRKLNLCSKTNIGKTAWKNACQNRPCHWIQQQIGDLFDSCGFLQRCFFFKIVNCLSNLHDRTCCLSRLTLLCFCLEFSLQFRGAARVGWGGDVRGLPCSFFKIKKNCLICG